MKRSGNVGLVLMGAATFAATFAAGTAYLVWSKPAGAVQANALAQPQSCMTRPDGSQDCQPRPRSYSYYVFPSHGYGWWGWSRSADATARPQVAALTSTSSRAYVPAPSTDTVRSGFGSTAQGFTRVSAGG